MKGSNAIIILNYVLTKPLDKVVQKFRLFHEIVQGCSPPPMQDEMKILIDKADWRAGFQTHLPTD